MLRGPPRSRSDRAADRDQRGMSTHAFVATPVRTTVRIPCTRRIVSRSVVEGAVAVLGDDRLAWLRPDLPMEVALPGVGEGGLAVVHVMQCGIAAS